MDTTNTFISTGMSAGLYILYKMAQRYYFRSGCHNNTLEISIIDKDEEAKKEAKKEAKEDHKEEKEAVIEMV
jgi:hypothetical protein